MAARSAVLVGVVAPLTILVACSGSAGSDLLAPLATSQGSSEPAPSGGGAAQQAPADSPAGSSSPSGTVDATKAEPWKSEGIYCAVDEQGKAQYCEAGKTICCGKYAPG